MGEASSRDADADQEWLESRPRQPSCQLTNVDAVSKERALAQARYSMLLKEELEKAEAEAHRVRVEAIQEAANEVALYYTAQAESQKQAYEADKMKLVEEAVKQARADEEAKKEAEFAALVASHNKALKNQKAVDDAATQVAIEKTKAEMQTDFGLSETGKQVVEEAVTAAMAQAERDERERAEAARLKAEAEKEAAIATAINKTIAEQAVKTKTAVARALAQAELKFAEDAERDKAGAVRKAELRMADATRLQCMSEFEDKMAAMREELSTQARKARLKDQVLDAMMADKHPSNTLPPPQDEQGNGSSEQPPEEPCSAKMHTDL